jgi:hypothetical protein
LRLPCFSTEIVRHPLLPAQQLINIHDIRVASPCPMPWEAMRGDALVRHCDDCKLNVYNLSAMSEKEIQQLLAERQGRRVCVRFYRRADGTMLTQDCPRGLRRMAKIVSKLGAAALSAILSISFAAAKTKTQPQACQRVQTQESSSNMLIVVADPDGAVVPGAKVALLDQSGKTRFNGKTDGKGSLMKSDLPAGDYTLQVTVHGFKEISSVLHLEHGKNVQVTLKLALAGNSETVEVTADSIGVMGTVGILSTSAPVTAPLLPPGNSRPAPMRQ